MSAWAEDQVELRIGSLRGFEATAACALSKQDPFSSASFEARSAPLPYPTRSQ